MTPAEESAVKLMVQQIARESMDDGLRAAVSMIRMAKQLTPHWTFDQLANAIEATLSKSTNDN